MPYLVITLLLLTGFAARADLVKLTTGTEVATTITVYSNMFFHAVTEDGKAVRYISGSVKQVEFAERARPITIETRNGPVTGHLLRYEGNTFHLEDTKGKPQTVAAILVRSVLLPPPGKAEPVEMEEAGTAKPMLEIKDAVTRGEAIELKDLLVPGKITLVYFFGHTGQPGVQCILMNNYLDNVVKDDRRVAVRKIDILGWTSPVAEQFKVTAVPRVDVYDSTGQLVQSIVGNRQPELMTALKRTR